MITQTAPTKGCFYIATGLRFVEEARRSAERVRQIMPGLPIALASETAPEDGLFDKHITIKDPSGSFADKIGPLSQTPFEETLFLDTDTYLCAPVAELFELLHRCDIAMAHAPMRVTGSVPVPPSFPECNSGVIVYRRNERTKSLFEAWKHAYAKQLVASGQPDDQPALREALWQTEAKLAILPPEYNFRFVLPSFAGRGPVKILHGRHPHMAALADEINSSGSPRVFLPQLRDASPRKFRILSWPGKMLGMCIAADAFCAKWSGKVWDGIRARCGAKS